MGFLPLIPQIIEEGVEASAGVERGAAQALGGAVHDALGMPQAMINTFYNFGGFVLGNLLLFIGVGMIIMHLFGDVVRDAVGGVEGVLGGGTTSNAVTKTAKGATIADTIAETAVLL